MEIAIVENGQVLKIGTCKELFPHVYHPGGNPSIDWLHDNKCKIVTEWKEHDQSVERLVYCSPYVEGDKVYRVKVEALPQQQVETSVEEVPAE